jgi:uncharacterized protein with FMN-binding domain
VRISTKLATGLMGVGVLAVSFKLGLPAQHAIALSGATPQTSAQPSPSAPAATQPSKAPTTQGGVTAKPKPKPKPASKPVTPPATGGGNVTAASATKTGDAILYRFGTVQVSVTKDAAGAITAISTVQASATGGRQAAFNSLQVAAVSAQGSSFGNISQATYTTQAFKDALDSALAKF